MLIWGGGVEWEVVPLKKSADEIENASADNPIVTNFLFKNPWRQRGGFVIDGFDRKETLEMISEAVIKSREMTNGRYKDKIIFKVILASRLKRWANGE